MFVIIYLNDCYRREENAMGTDSNRERILNAALDLFSRRGYDGTSVDEIAM